MTQEVATLDTSKFVPTELADSNTNIQELLEDNLEGESLSPFDLERITLPAGGATTWAVPTIDGEKDVKDLKAVIIMPQSSRSFWKEELTGEGTPPDCSSEDMIQGVGDPGGLCASCQYNQFGSGKQGTGKACKETKNLFILLEGSRLPYVLQVPPTSLKSYKKYMGQLTGTGKSVNAVVTSFTIEKTKSGSGFSYGKIIFRPAGELTQEQVTVVKQYRQMFKGFFTQNQNAATPDSDAPRFEQ